MKFTRLLLPDGEIDLASGMVQRQHIQVTLEAIEIRFLSYLAERPNQLVQLPELHQTVWEISPKAKTRAVYYAVRRLRERLEVHPRQPTVLIGTENSGFGLQAPSATSYLIGRNAELLFIQKQLESNLFTILTGPAGVGTSRLLFEVAQHFCSPIIDIQGISSIHALAAAICQSYHFDAGPHPLQTVQHVIRQANIIVIDHLDSLEPDAFAAMISWRHLAPQVRWLCASHAPILSIPHAIYTTIPPLNPSDSKALFYQYLKSGSPHTSFQDSEIDELIAHLDGLPLAVEIAAWHARTLPLRSIQQAIVSAPKTNLSTSNKSLEASITLGWSRLSHIEQQAIIRLCSLKVAVPLEAALAVTELQPSGLSQLVNAGFIRIDTSNVEPLYIPFSTVQWFVGAQNLVRDGCKLLAQWWLDKVENTSQATSWWGLATHGALLHAAAYLLEIKETWLGGSIAIICLRNSSLFGGVAPSASLHQQMEQAELDPLLRARWEWQNSRLTGSLEPVIAAYQRLIPLLPPNEFIPISFDLVGFYYIHGNASGAKETLENIRARSIPNNAQIDIETSIFKRNWGEWDEAKSIIEKVLSKPYAIENNSLSLALCLNACFYADQGQHETALAYSKEALTFTTGFNTKQLGAAWYRHGHISRYGGYYEEAHIAYQKALTLFDPLIDAGGAAGFFVRLNIAFLKLEEGRPEAARQQLLQDFNFGIRRPECFSIFKTILEVANLRCGLSPTPFSTEAVISAMRPTSLATEAIFLGWFAEIEYRHGFLEKALTYLDKMSKRIEQAGVSMGSESGQAFTQVKALLGQNL